MILFNDILRLIFNYCNNVTKANLCMCSKFLNILYYESFDENDYDEFKKSFKRNNPKLFHLFNFDLTIKIISECLNSESIIKSLISKHLDCSYNDREYYYKIIDSLNYDALKYILINSHISLCIIYNRIIESNNKTALHMLIKLNNELREFNLLRIDGCSDDILQMILDESTYYSNNDISILISNLKISNEDKLKVYKYCDKDSFLEYTIRFNNITLFNLTNEINKETLFKISKYDEYEFFFFNNVLQHNYELTSEEKLLLLKESSNNFFEAFLFYDTSEFIETHFDKVMIDCNNQYRLQYLINIAIKKSIIYDKLLFWNVCCNLHECDQFLKYCFFSKYFTIDEIVKNLIKYNRLDMIKEITRDSDDRIKNKVIEALYNLIKNNSY
jgi:hypothetical protein